MSEWISFSEEQPPHNTRVLVLAENGDIEVAEDGYIAAHFSKNAKGQEVWQKEYIYWRNPYHGGYDYVWDFTSDGSDFTHWMPLPEIPK